MGKGGAGRAQGGGHRGTAVPRVGLKTSLLNTTQLSPEMILKLVINKARKEVKT